MNPRVDSHHHFWDPSRFHYPWMQGDALDPVRRAFAPADLAPALESHGIDGTVLVQTISALDETRDFLALAGSVDYIWGVVGWVDLVGDVPAQLEELRSSPGGDYLVGIRHQAHDEEDAGWLTRPQVMDGVSAVLDAGLTYDLLVRSRELPAAIELSCAYPKGSFVLDHIAKPTIAAGSDATWSSLIPQLAANDNVCVKLSGMVTEADWADWTAKDLRPFVSEIVDAFGHDRLMFGSDWPVCLLATTYDEMAAGLADAIGDLSDAQETGLYGGNAIRAYRLDARQPL